MGAAIERLGRRGLDGAVCAADTSFPSSSTLPPVWRKSPAMMRKSVLLPQPDGPTMATNSPTITVRSMRSSACVAAPPRRKT